MTAVNEAAANGAEDLADDEVEAQPIKDRYLCPIETCTKRGATKGGIRHHITSVHNLDGSDFEIKSVKVPYGATVFGPNGEKIRILFYPSGAMRVRAHEAGPMALSEAFLTGEGKNVIVKLIPIDSS
jgi:hypothetical protein